MANFEDKMCCAAAKELVVSLDSLKASHFKENPVSDRLIATIYRLNLSDQQSLILRTPKYVHISVDIVSLDRQLISSKKVRRDTNLKTPICSRERPMC